MIAFAFAHGGWYEIATFTDVIAPPDARGGIKVTAISCCVVSGLVNRLNICVVSVGNTCARGGRQERWEHSRQDGGRLTVNVVFAFREMRNAQRRIW